MFPALNSQTRGPAIYRYEDNGDAVNHLIVTIQKTDKNNINGFGGPEKFLNEIKYLLGEQTFTGALLVKPL
jgi:hypothetical protein